MAYTALAAGALLPFFEANNSVSGSGSGLRNFSKRKRPQLESYSDTSHGVQVSGKRTKLSNPYSFKADFGNSGFNSSSRAPEGYSRNMPRFKRRFRRSRRRFRRRIKRSFRRKRGGSMVKLIRRTIIRHSQQHKINQIIASQALTPTDGTAPKIFILCPQLLATQGTATSAQIGNKIYYRGFRVRLNMIQTTAEAPVIYVRAWMVASKFNSPVTTAGTVMNSTTDATTNPACGASVVADEGNVKQFDSRNAASSPFVGENIYTPFDTSNARVLKMFHWKLQSFGQSTTRPSVLKDLWFPINRVCVQQDTSETLDPNAAGSEAGFFKGNNYYFCIQIYTGLAVTDAGDATTSVTTAFEYTVYWKNL
jgi:hypothetical protein